MGNQPEPPAGKQSGPAPGRPVKGNNRLVRRMNRQIVLNVVRERGPVSRAEIAKVTLLYPATVAAIVRVLESEGFLRRAGTGVSTGGRLPVLFELDPRSFGVVAVDIRVSDLRVMVADLHAQPLALETRQLDPAAGPPAITALAAELVQRLRAGLGAPPPRILGAGVTFPGPVEAATGTILTSPNLSGWERFSLAPRLQARLGLPTWVENDADACAWAEKWFGAARDRHDLVFLLADAGIGSGIIIGDEIYRGRNAAGEVGHLTVDPNGLRCNCGNWGCLETAASGLALVRRMAAALKGGAKSELAVLTGGDPEAVRLEHLFLAAEHGDPLVCGALDEAARCLGTALGSLLNVLSPEMVLLGGPFFDRLPGFAETVRETALRRSFPAISGGVEIEESSLKDRATLVGGAAVVLMRLFRNPEALEAW